MFSMCIGDLVPQRELQQVVVRLQPPHEVIDDDQVQGQESVACNNRVHKPLTDAGLLYQY